MSPRRSGQTPVVTEHSSLVRMDVDSLIRLSLGAALGVVTESFPPVFAQDEVSQKPLVYTDHEIDVERPFGLKVPSRIVVRTLGGDTEELSMRVPDAPTFALKEKVIVFLSKDTGRRFELEPEAFTTMGWFQGKLTVASEFVLIPGEREPMPLDAFLEKLIEGEFNHG